MIRRIAVTSLVSALVLHAAPGLAKTQWLTGGLIGGSIGLVGGVGSSYYFCKLAEENKTSCRQTAVPLAGALLGGAGFGIGALVGSLVQDNPYAVPDSTSTTETQDSTINPTLLVSPATGTYGVGAIVTF